MVGPSASVLTAAELSAFGSRTSRVRARFGGALTWGVRLDTAGTVAVLSSPSEVAGAGGGGAAAAMDGSLSTGVAAGPRSAAGEATSATRVGALPAERLAQLDSVGMSGGCIRSPTGTGGAGGGGCAPHDRRAGSVGCAAPAG